MSIEYEAIVFAYAAATIVGVLLGANLWYHREKTDAAPMSVFVVGSVLWSGSLPVISELSFFGDFDRVVRPLENLFRISIEHGIPNEHDEDDVPSASLAVDVGVLTSDRGDPVGFYVADDGRGLPEEGERVFEDGYSTAQDGTGFGLSIVRSIATAHGWSVEAGESDSGGPRFEFRGVEITVPAEPEQTVR